eukprot:CAMPEP_0116129718 /NCGR_PEP_ID=MMETSP0329-20121206/8067_1 /TAXON_ID=697910 /ORGANISM="Pseudo-nitzschia arenysensis, Strain B593" /LENGTH=356 /DNA_ID=CAMNT_0003623991 /DNA_START=58 /DNA_END=1128 /DNA_ORIENTATION=-
MIAPNLPAAVALGTTAFAIAFAGFMDADPTLYLYDKFFVNERKLKQFFHGKSIWITGASSGIGRELAVRASRYGVKNLILTGRSSERLQVVADYCSDQSPGQDSSSKISVLPLDMTAPEDEFDRAMSTLENILGEDELDCVLLNAGRGQLKPADRTSFSTTSEIFQINALAPIALTQQLLERGILREKRKQRQQLVVTSSVGALVGLPLSSSYAASKHAVHGYFNTLRAEKTWLDIKLICPGTIDSSFHSSYVGGSNPQDTTANDSGASDQKKKSSKLKMSIDRCVRLYMSSLLLRNSEYWIAAQPTLSGIYINRYFPGIFQALLAKVGTLRVKAWEEGKDLYDPETWKEMSRRKK